MTKLYSLVLLHVAVIHVLIHVTVTASQGTDDKSIHIDSSNNKNMHQVLNRGRRSPAEISEQTWRDLLNEMKRADWKSKLCGKWEDWCSPTSSNPTLQCCDQYVCKCNLWNTNCRCGKRLFSRRWSN